ncbi:MAG: purine-nucleoside phosphorylase [Bdellovibrionales bacterium]
METIAKLNKAAGFLKEKITTVPKIGIVLGSGLSDLAESLEVSQIIPFADIPYFPRSTVVGHKGNLIIGSYKGLDIALFQGRVHYYEGYSPEEVVFPARLFKWIGGEDLILTNAAGSLNPNWPPGDMMVIKDQLNFTGYNPLIGENISEIGPRFNDMSEPYNKELSELLKAACIKAGLNTHEGSYLGVTGPSYETPAEIKAFSVLGASAVGMSTVPECIAANHAGLRVAGLSCLTNFASGISPTALSHEEVTETSLRVKPLLVIALKLFFESYKK